MFTRRTWITAIAALAVTGMAYAFTQFTVITHDQNICANRLEGSWEIDTELTRQLDPNRGSDHFKRIVFEKDRNALDRIAMYSPRYANRSVFCAGTMKVSGTEVYPFVLTNENGNMILSYFTPTKGNPVGEVTDMAVHIGCSRDKNKDMLFLGGDAARESACAFSRVPTKPNPER